MNRVACVDFDGVIHEYTRWDGNPPTGKPIPGVHTALTKLALAGFEVVVFSARDSKHIESWLEKNGLSGYVASVTNIKIPADVYFDDRAVYVPSNIPGGLLASFDAFLRNGGFPLQQIAE